MGPAPQACPLRVTGSGPSAAMRLQGILEQLGTSAAWRALKAAPWAAGRSPSGARGRTGRGLSRADLLGICRAGNLGRTASSPIAPWNTENGIILGLNFGTLRRVGTGACARTGIWVQKGREPGSITSPKHQQTAVKFRTGRASASRHARHACIM
jgi:hypothetical protein